MLRRLNPLRVFKAHDGTAAVEFALIAPILVVIYIGLTELGLGMMASRRTSHLAATVGDLVAQSESVTTSNLSDIFDIGTSILQPFEGGTNLEIRVSSLKMAADGKAHVEWSDDRNWTGTPYVEDATTGTVIASVTTSQLPAGEYLIMTEVSYTYTAPITKFLPSPVTFNYTFYHHPRSGGDVVRK